MKVYQIPVGPMQNFSYIVEDESTHEAIVIDPSWDLEKLTEIINESIKNIVSVDVPSGLNPDTGEANKRCVNANMTVTFHRMKVGMQKRTDVCGEIFVEKIGIPTEAEIGVL